MKTSIKMLSVFAAIALVSPLAQANRESGGRIAASAVYLNFASYGTGIDSQSYEIAEQFIADVRAKGAIVAEVRKPWGREGEVLRCVQLMDSASRAALIAEVAPSILADRQKTGQVRTSVRVGLSCDNYDAATEQNLEAYTR